MTVILSLQMMDMQPMERAAKPDPHKHHYVRSGWCAGWKDLGLERIMGCCWTVRGN